MEIKAGFNLRSHILELEREFIYSALSKTMWQKSSAARMLGMNRTTLVEKMRRLGLPLHSPYNKKEEKNGN